MPSTPIRQSLFSSLVVALSALAFFSSVFFPASLVRAQTVVQVSASMPDVVAPSTPILISPTDGATTTDSTPTFIWKQADDNVAVTSYTLYLDGVVTVTNIPVIATDNATYTLTYDATTGQYALTLKASTADGSHTWKIVAQDARGNSTASTTWSFLIDTLAPTFVINMIGAVETSISVQDIATVPTAPIELRENKPLLAGTGEANSSVVLQLRRQNSDDLVEEYHFLILSDGSWSVQLRSLARDTVFLLTFQITDQAGLLSILEDVPIIIRKYVIALPSVRTALISFSKSSSRLLSPLWYTHLLVLFFLLALPLLKFLLLAAPFGRNFSLNIGRSIWSAIVGYASDEQASLIINAADQRALPYMTIRLVPVNQTNEAEVETESRVFLSDAAGFLPALPQVSGSYRLQTAIDEQAVAYQQLQPAHLSWEDWYRGEAFSLQSTVALTPLVVPIDSQSLHQTRSAWRSWILRQPIDSMTLMVLAISLLLLTPTIGNFITTLVFGSIWVRRTWNARATNCHLAAVATNKLLIPFTIFRLKSTEPTLYSKLYHAGGTGEAAIRLKNGVYDCGAIHSQYRQKLPLVIDQTGGGETTSIVYLAPILP